MLHLETIEPETLGLLKNLMSSDIFSESRLVGGTALALQLGHRKSVDLDMFGHIEASPEDVSALYSSIGETKVLAASKSIRVFSIDGVKVDAVNYSYPWLDEPIVFDGIRLASLRDIAAMKVAAIINRGTKKDFIDMHFLLKQFSMKEILDLYSEKFADGSLFIALKSMTYFEDAESDPMPYMFHDVSWEDVKISIKSAIRTNIW